MKKLMFAMAVIAAGAAMADVTSANVVGYQELNTTDGGRKMVVPTFLNVGESNKVSLADLKVTGYRLPEWDSKSKKYIYGCGGGQFLASPINANGLAENNYYWIDNGTVGPGWFADDVGGAIEGGAGSVKFDAGKGLWTFGSTFKLVPAGAVNPFDIVYKTCDGGRVVVGNCTPVDLPLSDLTVTGYKPPEWDSKSKKYIYGCGGGQFLASLVNTSGLSTNDFYWIDNGNITPGWYSDDVGTPIAGGANAVIIQAGQGLWTFGSTYKLVIPAPELK